MLLLCLSTMLTGTFYAYSQSPGFSHQAGFYTEAFDLNIACPDEFPQAWITRDGSWPGPDNPESELYTGPILIDSRAGDANFFSLIPLNNGDSGIPAWLPPTEEVMKATIITAGCFLGNVFGGKETRTFWIHESGHERYSLPVISIVAPPESFFDFETGIKVPGIHYVEGNNQTGNYFQSGSDWERMIHIELIEPDGTVGLSQNAGIRIHGNFTRSYPRKSMRLYARSDYGTSRFEHKIFEDQPVQRFNRLILRTSGNDFGRSLFRDALAHRLYRNIGIETQDYRPFILFLNGEYWGIYNIRERYDRHYFERVHGVERENLDYIDFWFRREPYVNEGSSTHYMEMLNFAVENDLSVTENFASMQSRMDTDDFINMVVMGIYSSNTDWPRTNVRAWRTRNEFDPDAGKTDGRWRWLLNDIDFGFGLFQNAAHNHFGSIMNDRWEGELLMSLLQNDTFKHRFINRFADHIHSVFNPAHTETVISWFMNGIDSEIAEHVRRWQYPTSYNSWSNNANNMKNWLASRPDNIRQQLIERFELDGLATFTADVNQANAGIIKLNSIRLAPETDGIGANPYPFEATYFAGVPVRLEAIPNAGYRFDGWEGHESNEPVITVDPAQLETITAVFVFEPFEGDEMNPVAHDLSTGDYLFDFWSPEQPELTFPDNMVFQQTRMTDPGLHDEMTDPYFLTEEEYHEDDAASIGFPYALTRRTRINALGDNGISFINTGRNRDLGAAVLALDTREAEEVYVNFVAGTVTPNSREYAIRLQWRIGNQGAFTDVTDSSGNPVEYVRNTTSGHETVFSDIRLPEEAAGVPYLQLRWKYYHVSGNSGPRAELRLDDILVRTEAFVSVPETGNQLPRQFTLHQNYPNPFNPTTNISFELPVQSDIVLEVFNVTGQRVATLASGTWQAGSHTVAFNAQGLASGLYLYRLRTLSTAAPVQLTGKMMLLR